MARSYGARKANKSLPQLGIKRYPKRLFAELPYVADDFLTDVQYSSLWFDSKMIVMPNY